MQTNQPSSSASNGVNPYIRFAVAFSQLLKEGKSYPLGGMTPRAKPGTHEDAPRVLLCSPHPDDECVIGALPLRLLRERRMNVINVAITQGSRKDRQAARLEELRGACDYLGFNLVPTRGNGLEKILLQTRDQDREYWNDAVTVLAEIIEQHEPQLIFLPHANDWNTTHIGVHFLVMDALRKIPAAFHCRLVETEFWGAMSEPNLMIESSPADVADLITALSFHAGEVERNPYHLRLPAWMIDNVRRGGELLSGKGAEAPDYTFATLYRLRRWNRGKVEDLDMTSQVFSCDDSLEKLFG